MVISKRIPQTVLLILLGVVLATSQHSTVEATSRADTRSSRRVPGQRVRGLQREIVMNDEGMEEKVIHVPKGEPKVPKTKPQLPQVFRPIPENISKLGLKAAKEKIHGVNLKKRPPKREQKLPEDQALNLKVNKQKVKYAPEVGTLSSGKKRDDRIKIGKNNKKSNGLEHFTPVDVEVYRREIPSFTLKFTVEDPSPENPPNLADYNELSDVSEEYLDGFFQSVFEDLKVMHHGTVVFLMVNEEDPYTVEYQVTLEFEIPGEVPTINFLINSLQDALETDTSQAFFIADLSSMSETNPFSKTASIKVVSRPPVAAAEMGPGGEKKPGIMEHVAKNTLLISLLASTGCVILIGAAIMWRRKRTKGDAVSDSNQTFSLFDKSNKGASADSKTSGAYGADEETMNYLSSIRKRYRDHVSGGSDNNLQQTASDDGETSISGTVDEC